MNFTHTGLFISVLILLGMLITCHLRNYMRSSEANPKSDFINLAIPTGTPPLRYNQISYSDQRRKIPCEIAAQANVPCSQIQTPCTSGSTSTDSQMYQLSDSELAIIYKLAYEQAGLELMNRVLRQ